MLKPSLIICGGGLVENSLAVHFGKISPLFLPLMNKPLIEYQLMFSKLNSFENTFILIPEDEISRLELLQIDKENPKIHFHPVDPNLDLIQALKNVVDKNNLVKVCVLLGDTLYDEKIPIVEEDFVSINETFLDFNWNRINSEDIASGLFYFKDISKFFTSHKNKSFKQTLTFYLENYRPKYIRTKSWLDFGHFSTYIKSKFNYTAERSFNQIYNTTSSYLIKQSSNSNKIIGEYLWFSSFPEDFNRGTTPIVKNLKISNNSASYQISKVFLPNLAEVYLYGNITVGHFANIFQALQGTLNGFLEKKSENPEKDSFRFLQEIETKTKQRIALIDIDIKQEISLNGNFKTTIEAMLKEIRFTSSDIIYENSFYHGDLCLSNMFYDVNANQLILIDPRGVDFSGQINPFGNIIYDQAKFYHSIVGQYDNIISGMYSLDTSRPNEYTFRFIDINRTKHIAFYRKEIQAIERTLLKINIHLFLSMIPLHSDSEERQNAFLANSLRLFKIFRDEF
ncbi:MAG: hypothetical protein O3C47_05415 [Bacteroidetes bacterium]|nr:hypothetical protein [Bacteroidota bacterium]